MITDIKNENENEKKTGKKMKRDRFYVSSLIWDQNVGSSALLVFTYLCSCANAAGECFPSIKTIAEGCRFSKSTVKRCLKQLLTDGVISIEERYLLTNNSRRRTTNLYRVPVCFSNRQTVRESDQKKEETAAVLPPASDLMTDEEEALDALMDRLRIRDYDGDLKDMLLLTLEEMWRKPFTLIGGERIPCRTERNRLEMLSGDAVRNAVDALSRLDVQNPAAYFKSCLYNAPAEMAAKATAFNQKLKEYGVREALGVM